MGIKRYMIKALKEPTDKTKCKICKANAILSGPIDFNRSCEDRYGNYFFPIAKIPVYYYRCTNCELFFTESFDNWNKQDFKDYIYNDGYILTDKEYDTARPEINAEAIYKLVTDTPKPLKILDYGSGNGKFSQILKEKYNIDSDSYEPMDDNRLYPKLNYYDIVTAYEVFEHMPNPLESTKEMLSFLKVKNSEQEAGIILFSTFLIEDIKARDIHHWYFAPRNGHVTIYNRKSLNQLFSIFEYKVCNFSDNYHGSFKDLPSWAPQ